MKKTIKLFSLIAVLGLLAARAGADCGHCEKGHDPKGAAGKS